MQKNPYFIDLINSLHMHSETDVEDGLAAPGGASALLRRHGLEVSETPKQLRELVTVRSCLRNAIEELMGDGCLSERTVEMLNSASSAASLRYRFYAAHGSVVMLEAGALTPAAAAVQSFARFLADEDWRRLKLCQNSRCRWAFIDESRNRSRQWCSSQACGNLIKVRAFRARASARNGAASTAGG